MGMREIESTITYYARTILNNRSLRVKDIREWSTGEVKAQEGEVVIHIADGLNVNVAYFTTMDKRNKLKAGTKAKGGR